MLNCRNLKKDITWRTVYDDHVRADHVAKDGMTRAWEESPDPGDDFNCRCWAGPAPRFTHHKPKKKQDIIIWKTLPIRDVKTLIICIVLFILTIEIPTFQKWEWIFPFGQFIHDLAIVLRWLNIIMIKNIIARYRQINAMCILPLSIKRTCFSGCIRRRMCAQQPLLLL